LLRDGLVVVLGRVVELLRDGLVVVLGRVVELLRDGLVLVGRVVELLRDGLVLVGRVVDLVVLVVDLEFERVTLLLVAALKTLRLLRLEFRYADLLCPLM
jgi:hypothetical protein